MVLLLRCVSAHDGHSEPAPSTGCPVLLSSGWTSPELRFGFALVTNSVGKWVSYIGR